MLDGHATPGGTAEFARRSPAPQGCYREAAGLTLSSVGVGTYLGEPDARTDSLVEAAVDASVRAGMNVVDTAINYRGQRAERSVGRALAALSASGAAPREALFVSTKGGYVTNDAEQPAGFWDYVRAEYVGRGVIGPGEISPGYHCMSPAYLEDQLRRSLRNLGLACVDLLYLHNPVEGQGGAPRDRLLGMVRGAFGLYERLRREGAIRFYGLATWECLRAPEGSPGHLSLEEAAGLAAEAGGSGHGMRFVQMPLNMHLDQAMDLRNQRVGGRLMTALGAASELGIGVFASAPLMQGRLLRPGVMPDLGGLAPAPRAIQFARSAPGVTAALAGHKDPAHVAENASVMSVPPVPPGEFAAAVEGMRRAASG